MKVRLGFWRVVFAVILGLGLYSTVLRFTQGLGSATHLSDRFPWGLWIGFDLLCGVGLAAGGFAMAATVHIFNVKRFEPVIRPAILTAFLGYLLVIFALLIDLGRPWMIWHPIVMWNPRSVMFEVAWCVMLYTTVLAVEFSPAVLERLRWKRALSLVRSALPFFIIAGVLLSTLHQSSLGSLYLIVPNKLHPLWYSSWLPVLFFLSALAVGCCMVLMESFLSQRAFGHALAPDVRHDLCRMALVLLVPYALLRILDVVQRGAIRYAVQATPEAGLFWIEVFLGLLAPIALLLVGKVRQHPRGQFAISLLAILGFVMHRLNVSITGMEASIRADYFPAWTEVSITVMIVAIGFAVFGLAARHLPLFGHGTHAQPAYVGAAGREDRAGNR
ncbi:MAG: NrfD/PsrC family molybdoenzyme membrane anchor subunit [Candidatus Eisenbacteria bacterium]